MARRWVGSVLVGVAYVSASGGARPPARAAPQPVARGEADSRRTTPGVHRAGPGELAVRNRVAQAEAAKLAAHAGLRAQLSAVSVPATTWVSLGPTGALDEFNLGVEIDGVDSGRLNQIVVDPRDANVVYVAGSGGGVWKTFDFLAPGGPHWTPLGDTLANLAIGALALDDRDPDTLYLGNGDAIDGSGNTVLKTRDGGGTWGAPIVLDATYPAPNGRAAHVGSIRALGVRGAQVLAGTDAGLFVSQDGAASFALVDLPNVHGKVLVDSVWSVIQTGDGHWVASGVTGCDEASDRAPLSDGVDPGPTCEQGNNAEIWYSADGLTWAQAVVPTATGTGRVTLAAGTPSDPSTTVVYAYVGSTSGSATLGFWRSNDGGVTWADATGTLVNPTQPVNGVPECGDTDRSHTQTWYDQAIVVDPTNPDHVLAAGSLCSARTLNGTAASPTWELVSHWLPNWQGGVTANGRLPYVHADWHGATSIVDRGAVRTFAATDGGVFTSTDVFDPAVTGEHVAWTHHNNGLVNHLLYTVGSGDPVTSNPFVLFAGLQDDGTRYRVDPAQPSVFNQPIGGDGIGATVHVASSGITYWGSAEFQQIFCQPAPNVDCASGTNWFVLNPILDADPEEAEERERKRDAAAATHAPGHEDQEPFLIHYANVETDTVGPSVLTHSEGQIFVVTGTRADNSFGWTPISQDLTGKPETGFTNVSASRTIPGLYGATGAVSLAPFWVTTAGNQMTAWTAAKPVFPTGTLDRLTGASSIDFPPVLPAGTVPGQVFIGAFSSTMNDKARTPPPDDKGHLWRTTDFGQTWTSIVGGDPAHRLPNVAIYVVKYDPVTPTTIYAGTDLGIYVTIDDGATWDRMGEGFPVVPVRDIYVAKNQDFIRVATYGRGLWEIYPSAAANQGAPGNGDYDRNLRLDWIDLAAVSSRLDRTPANATPPLYSWIMDLTANAAAPVQQIDDADLAALLAGFGGHP